MEGDEVLDCLGLYCPMPIVETSRKIKEMEEGEILEIVADDPGIKQDMPSWCAKTGHEFLGVVEEGGELHVFVRKKGA